MAAPAVVRGWSRQVDSHCLLSATAPTTTTTDHHNAIVNGGG